MREELKAIETPPPRPVLSQAPLPYRSLLRSDPRAGRVSTGLVAAILLHVLVIGAAVILPRFFDKPRPPKPVILARLVAFGKPRPQNLLPLKQSPPPPAPAAPPSRPAAPTAPTVKSTPAPARSKATVSPPRAPSRAQLMQQALGLAKSRVSDEKPDPEREGQATGSPEGTATTAEEGDKYFTEVHDAIQANYVVPSVISERERMYLTATVVVYVGPDGSILKHEVTKPSGNAFFDQALVLAIQRTKLPAPPRDLVKLARDGLELNFRP